MHKKEFDFFNKRNIYRIRRNRIRRVFLVGFIIMFLYCGTKLINHSSSNNVQIEIVNNYLLKNDYIANCLASSIKTTNFFLINPLNLSNSLVTSEPLFKNIIIRKYLFPTCKIVAFVEEEKIWGKLLESNKSYNQANNTFKLITDDCNLVTLENLNLTLIPNDLFIIELFSQTVNLNQDLKTIKLITEWFKNNLTIGIQKIIISDNDKLDILMTSGLKIKAGVIDSDIIKRVNKVKDILDLVKYNSGDGYLDLTLESGAIFKQNTDSKTFSQKKGLFSIFKGQ